MLLSVKRMRIQGQAKMRGQKLLVVVVAGLASCSSSMFAQSACDLNGDGTVNVVDGQLAVNMSLGLTPCSAKIAGQGVCNSTVVQRVMNAALGMSCVVDGTAHSVSLTWSPSGSSGVAGYNVYRGSSATGPFIKVNANTITATTYSDGTVQAGQTYYYVATAVTSAGAESGYSTATRAVVPSP